MSFEPLLVFTGVYVAAHFFFYAVFLRYQRPFFRESVIFFYHFLSMTALGVFFLLRSDDWTLTLAALSLHGIYSLTFLEFWSLSDGGYSLRILDSLTGHRDRNERQNWTKLEELGRQKKESRIQGLTRLGLVHKKADKFELTVFGRALIGFLFFIAWLSGAKRAME